MRAATVEDVAQEFMRIIAEGWSPDPEEFLHRVPEDLREECRARLNELLAERAPAAPEPEPEAAPETDSAEDDVIFFDLDTPEAPAKKVVEEPAAAEEQEPVEPAVEAAISIAVETALEPVEEEVPEEIPEEEAPEEVAEEIVEPVEEPEQPEPPAPTGPQRLSREEAKAMFREMELARKS